MTRRAIRLIVVLLICVGLGLAWWRSYATTFAASLYLHRGWGQFVVLSRGTAGVVLSDVPAGAAWSWDASRRPDEAMSGVWDEIATGTNIEKKGWTQFCGIRCLDASGKTRLYAAVVPTPAVLGAMVVVLIWAMRAWRRARREVRQGLCPVCGYDLRHSSGRCPECGTPIATPEFA